MGPAGNRLRDALNVGSRLLGVVLSISEMLHGPDCASPVRPVQTGNRNRARRPEHRMFVSDKQPDIDIEIHSMSVPGCLRLSVVTSYILHVTGACVFLSCPSDEEGKPELPL
jgi:hypothetical protein